MLNIVNTVHNFCLRGHVKHDIKRGVSQQKSKLPKKEQTGVRMDSHTRRLVEDGSKIYGNKSKFVRAAVRAYFGLEDDVKPAK